MVNLNLLLEAKKPSKQIKDLVEKFISPEGVGRRYLFGRNEHSALLAELFEIEAFVDDFVESGSLWKGRAVIHGDEVPQNAILINCSMSIMPVSASKRIDQLQISGSFTYHNLLDLSPELVTIPCFIDETCLDFKENLKEWEKLENSLFDEDSKEVLRSILKYRLTGDYSYMEQFSFRPKDQYFEDFLNFEQNEIFVDAGGFDGDTTEIFCEKNPDYDKVFLFEPDITNLKKAKIRLRDYKNINYIPLAVSDKEETLWFNENNGSSSSIGDSGNLEIKVTTIDKHIQSKATFIKMDLEGWELKALMGSKRHILEDHPKMAIAVYHHPSDFWKIFNYIFNLRQDYKVFLRHYTEGWSETIMYFVPK